MKKIACLVLVLVILLSVAACGNPAPRASTTPYVPGSGFGGSSSPAPSGAPESAKPNEDKAVEDKAADGNKDTTEKPVSGEPEYYYLPTEVKYESEDETTVYRVFKYDSAGLLAEYADYHYGMAVSFISDAENNLIPAKYSDIMDESENFLYNYEISDYTMSGNGISELIFAAKYPSAEMELVLNITGLTYDSGGALQHADISLVSVSDEDEREEYSLVRNSPANYSVEVLTQDAEGRPLTREGTKDDDFDFEDTFEYDAQGRLRQYTYEYYHWIWEFTFSADGCLSSYKTVHTPSGGYSYLHFSYQAFPAESFKGEKLDYINMIVSTHDVMPEDRTIMTSQIPEIVRVLFLQIGSDNFDYRDYQG